MLTLNILCSVAACVPIFWIGRRVRGVATGALAAWMWALLPTAIIIPYQWVWDTSLAALLVALIAAATLSPAATWGAWDWGGYGLLWGFALMTNPSLAAALPFLFFWAVVRSNRAQGDSASADERATRWKHAGMALGIAVLCCVPWTVRNYRAFHTLVPMRSTLPLQLWLGNNELYDPALSRGPWLANAARDDIRSYVRLGEVAFMREKGEEARVFISAHPVLYAELTWRRVVAFWLGLEHPWIGILGGGVASGATCGGGECADAGADAGRDRDAGATQRGGWVGARGVGGGVSAGLLFHADAAALPQCDRAGDCGARGRGDYFALAQRRRNTARR